MYEIGSEFWTNCTRQSNEMFSMRPSFIYDRHQCKIMETLSGRTALEYIVEILVSQGKRSVYMPAYCCHTMIEPFLSHEMRVEFYDIESNEKGIKRLVDIQNTSDVILLLDYFGYTDEETKIIAHQAKLSGKVVIYDATHSMYSRIDDIPYDFIYASYRKWVDINCGFFAWYQDLNAGPLQLINTNNEYTSIRTELFDKKASYIKGFITGNDEFLSLISRAEEVLENDYHHKSPDSRSMRILQTVDSEYIKSRRISNAIILTEAINRIKDPRVCCLNPILKKNDVPLFVPILVDSRHRNQLRQYLIENQIYCPVHWPLSNLHVNMSGADEIYASELSLVCDQRYTDTDMRRIIREINNYLSK